MPRRLSTSGSHGSSVGVAAMTIQTSIRPKIFDNRDAPRSAVTWVKEEWPSTGSTQRKPRARAGFRVEEVFPEETNHVP